MDTRHPPVRFSQCLISWIVCGLMVWQPMAPAVAAALTPTGQTTVDRAGNGVPVINIATPNGAGISHNQFQDYNVGKEGLILNNGTDRLTQTQLGGLIQNNPNLQAGREAKGIINEVTGASRSQLQGYTEVAGKAANVMVANPYGITCNGCGFINTPNATLTTGKPQFDANGNLLALDVTKGAITVEGQGLDASKSDALSIIARATEVNAAIHANDLKVTAGANRVGADGSVKPIVGEGASPVVAVDTGALGGMYANRIRLVSSEKGVGVNLGNLTARQGDIQLDAGGKLTITNSVASGSIAANGAGVTLNGSHQAAGALNVTSSQDVELNNSTLASQGDMRLSGEGKVQITGGSISSKGALSVAAGKDIVLTNTRSGSDTLTTLTSGGTLSSTGSAISAGENLALSGGQLVLDNQSRADATGDIRLTGGTVSNLGQVNAGRDAALSGDRVSNGGQLAAKGHLDVNARDLTNGGTVQGNDITLLGQTVTNNGTLQSAGTLALNADTLEQQGTLSAKGDANVTAQQTLRNGGSLLADGAMNVTAGSLEQNGTLSGATALTAQADTLTSGQASRTTSQGNVQLTATRSASLNGQTDAAGALTVSTSDLITDRDAHLQSGQALILQAQNATLNGTQAAKGALSVTAGTLVHAGKSTGNTLNFNATNDLTSSGELAAGTIGLSGQNILHSGVAKADRMTLTAADRITTRGSLVADSLSLDGASVENGGLLQGTTLLNLKTGSLANLTGGSLYSSQDLTLNIPMLNNSGLITTDGTLRIKGDTLTNHGEINGVSLSSDYLNLSNSGRLLADERITLNGTTLVNAGNIAASDLHMTANSLQNQGTVQGEDTLTLGVTDITNRGALRSSGTLTLNGDTLANSGELSATALLLNLTRQAANDADGRVIARDGLTLTAASLTNSGLMAGIDARFNSAAITNGGTLQGTHSLTATGAQLSNQQSGMLLSGGALELHHTTLNNAGLLQGNTLNLATGEWINTGNALGETGVTAAVTGALTNSGKVLSQQAVDVQAGSTDNRGQLLAKVLTLRGDLQNSGLLQGSGTLAWSGDTFVNQTQGQVTGGETLTLSGKTLSNAGSLQGRSATLGAENLSNQGSVQTLDALTLAATGRLDNKGALLSQNLFTLTAAQLFNDGQLAGKALAVNAAQLTNSGILQGNDALSLTTRALSNRNTGQLVSGSDLDLNLTTLDNAGLLLVDGGFTLWGSDLTNQGDIQAQSLDLGMSNTLTNTGNLVATDDVTLNATTLTNSGTAAGKTLTAGAAELRNSGLMQGSNAVNAIADSFINELNGKWLSGGGFTLKGGQLTNAGTLQGATLGMTGSTLSNSGTVNGQMGLSGTLSGTLTNTGLLQSGGATTFNADTLANPGRIMGGTLSLNARDLNNGGLMQGTNGLALTGTTLTTGANSRTLSGGMLTLDADLLTTQGTLQGNGADIRATEWTHGGSLLSQGTLTANAGGTLTSTGSLMSQGGVDITARTLDNRGQLLSEDNVTLGGSTLKNSGTVQGNSLTLGQSSINNQGTLTGLQSLTLQGQQRLMARMAMAAPQQELINGAGGKLLTQGTLTITSGAVTNAGSWQAQNILLNAQSLTNSGAVQSAEALQMTLADTLTGTAGSKITALGSATLQAATLVNQGQWAAKNLTLKSGTLSNSGAISGVNGLTLSQTGAVSQQSSGTLLSGGALNVTAASVTTDGKIQGGTLGITTGTLTNGGRLQGDSGATLALSGTLTNNGGGEIVSRDGLTLTTPTLFNYGLIQGGGETRVTASSQARNDGRLLSGARLTLGTPQFTGTGWLQATDLILNAASATNGGTWVADRATLTGTTLASQGTTQAGELTVNYGQLNNSGTLLGNAQLNINADQVTQSAGGKLLSGGNLWLQSKGLDVVGQLVSLGDLTLQLTNAFTSKTAVAAGRTLTINSGSDIDNRSVLQGQAVNLNAGGQLSNNGQITTGAGASTLSGSSVALNAAGSVQGGGDITVASRSNITVDGFTGTRGSLTLSAPGSIVNTALLYAANNLALFADSITNQRGDIMAGNNLWMQRDAAGNANSQVVNTSGNIETQNGDITVKTANLLNQRAGLATSTTTSSSPAYGWVGQATVDIPVSVLGIDTLVQDSYSTYTHDGSGTCGGVPCFMYEDTHYYYRPITGYETRKYALNQTAQVVNAEGGSARISSGRNLTITAAELNNQASAILANSNITLAGNTLNNQSYQSGTYTEYAVYKYVSPSYGGGSPGSYSPTHRNTYYDNDVTYVLDGHVTESENGETFRAVIQAGGNVTANFSSNISNTNTTANAGGVSNVISTPSLNTLSNQTIGSGVQKQGLSNTGTVAVNSPQWNDQLQSALQQLNGGGALENSGASGTSLSNIATTQKGNANLGQLGALANAGATTADLKTAQGGAVGHYQGQRVDTSAYPLPSGNNGYFVFSDNPKSPYLININPKLNGLGQLDPALFADLNAMLGIKPSSSAPQETRLAFTDEKQFLGSSYMLGRLNLNPDYDYRFLGDAAFDTRYVSNVVLNQTGNRYLNGIGSDLDQMRYLMDNAAAAQQSLGLQFGVSLTADQIAALDHSLLWWEKATVNGETVMVPKLYLSPKDVTVNNGSVIAGNNVTLKGGSITNSGSSLLANNSLTLDSQNSISNLNSGLMKAGGDLNLSAIGDINNISSTISGKTVALESLDGSINNLTQVEQIDINAKGKYSNIGLKDTLLGNTASITAQDGLSLEAGKNITVTGANLASGGDMLLNAWGDIAVNANQINDAYSSSREKTSRSSVTYQGSNVTAGGNLLVNAGHNLDVTASDLKAGGSAGLSAGNDLNLNAAQTSESSRKGKSESHSTGLDRTTISAGDNLVLKAGQDINAQAAALAAEKNVGLQASRDVNLAAEETTQGDSYRSGKKTVINESVRQQGTEIASGANTQILAGRDVTTEAAQVTAKGDIGVAAGRDVSLDTATESDYHYKEETKTKKGFLSKKTTHTIEENSATRESGSLLSGDNVQVVAGNNLRVSGSAVAGDGDVQLKAGNNVDIVAATNSDTSWRFKEEKKSGLMGSGGIGFTIGSSKSTHDLREKGTTQSQSFSTVGSTGGNVAISAGNQARIGGADLIAGKDLSLSGDSVIIEPGHDKRTRDETFEQKKSGLTVALSGTVGSAINNAVSAAQETKEQSDGRLKALQATKTVLSGVQAGQAADMAATTGDPNAMGVSLSLTTQKSKSQQHAESDAVAGSTLNAGNNLSITANGKNNGVNSGDIVIAGSQLKAGGDTTLDAQNDILLSGAANTQKTSGKNSSSGGGIGVSIGAGGSGAGISVFANVNAAHGKDKGNGTDWTETTIDSGKTVTLKSGHDTVLNGAQVNGDKIVADVGHDLLMRSQQNNSDYDSKQTSVAAGGSFTFGTMSGSGYINASQDKMKSRFDSVAEQTGLYAGDGGFDITVGHHTQLDGAVIASTATPDKNSLDTGTLGFSDIHNEADFKTSHSGISLSGGGSFGDKFQGNLPGSMISAAGNKGHKEGTTQAAVAEGSLTIRDKANQKQDVADLSRDTEHANDSISPIFDKEKEQNRLSTIGMIGDIGSQVADIAKTQGDLNGLKAAQKASGETLPANATEEQRQNYLAKLRNTQAYKEEMVKYGTGSDLQRGIQAATAALQGLAGGNIAGALAGASAPELAHMLKSTEGDPTVNTVAHAILGGAVAALQGNSAAAGAAGAASGELAAHAIASVLYPEVKDLSKLSEDQKQTVITLASVSAGMAGGLAGGSTASATAGAQGGKNAAENNATSIPLPSGLDNYMNAVGSWNQYAESQGLSLEEKQAGLDKLAKGDLPEGANITKVIVEGYQDGVMIGAAWYLGPAASVGKVVGGGVIAEIANGGYQWFSLSQPGNENKSWDYKSSISAGVGGMLAPGRNTWQNVGIAMGGAFFTDGPDTGSLIGSALGSWAGGKFGELAPFPGEVNDLIGGLGGELIGDKVKDKVNGK
ncbi:hemagglutinin repeat-containing protein [Enterobacter bugandensis]|uniref:hemagglutinin repeat-containing protein n=2 Tax=Enterobacter bugandensis TaxID=881260 RepID=UPI001D0C3E78|nr:hemagglutinin repeat-containing protein [Enterobacter bugandensis]MCC2002146.1 hemagglutinin repeat-containing protein [Enterobacter bugandensis]MDH2699080.1 hemagglutinin repeat-containing protein [Enterobacter bugandensis]